MIGRVIEASVSMSDTTKWTLLSIRPGGTPAKAKRTGARIGPARATTTISMTLITRAPRLCDVSSGGDVIPSGCSRCAGSSIYKAF